MTDPNPFDVERALREPGEDRELRIEALRAAATIMTVMERPAISRDEPRATFCGLDAEVTILIADKFLAWLSETPPHE